MVRALVMVALLVGWFAPAAIAATAEEPTQRLIAKAPAASAHPQASAVCLLNSIRLEVDDQFGTTKETRLVVKILNSQGREDYGQMRISYEAGEETVEIVKAVTYDGQREIAA